MVLGSEEQAAKRGAKTLDLGFLIYTYKYTGTTGQLVALQHSCKETVKRSASAWTQTRMGVQWAANTSRVTDDCTVAHGRARMEDQQAYLFHWWLCCFHLLRNTQSSFFFCFFFTSFSRLFFSIFFSKLRAKRGLERKAALNAAAGHESLRMRTNYTRASDLQLNKKHQSQPLNSSASPTAAGSMDSTSPSHCTFPSRRSLQFGSWFPVKAKATHKGINH